MNRFWVFSLILSHMTLLSSCASWVKPTSNQLEVSKRWVRSTVNSEYLGFRKLHRFTPLEYEGLIIQGNAIDGVKAYKKNNGNLAWTFPVKDGAEAGAEIAGGLVYFGSSDGYFYAIKADTGQLVWSFPIRSEGLGQPRVQGGAVYFLAGNNVAYALDAKTGRQIWLYSRRDASVLSIRGGSRPSLAGSLVVLGFSDGAVLALQKDNGSVVWESQLNRNKRFRDIDAEAIIQGDKVYVSGFDAQLFCLDLKSGKTLWTVDQGAFSGVLVDGQNIFISSSSGQILSLDRDSGKTAWKKDLKGVGTRPVKLGSTLLVGEYAGSLRVLDPRNGNDLQSFNPGRGVTSEPLVDSETGEVYFISADANLFALRLAWTKRSENWPWQKIE